MEKRRKEVDNRTLVEAKWREYPIYKVPHMVGRRAYLNW